MFCAWFLNGLIRGIVSWAHRMQHIGTLTGLSLQILDRLRKLAGALLSRRVHSGFVEVQRSTLHPQRRLRGRALGRKAYCRVDGYRRR
jgi:hypothetical protein